MAVDLAVEMFVDGGWVDITDDVRTDPGLTITFGIPNEAGLADPAQCNLTVNNRDGRYSPRNPAGPYYGHLTRNTPLRVLVDGNPRFAGEISEFPSRWNLPGTDVWSPLVASGILRRLNRSNALDSTLVVGVRSMIAAGHIGGYWPTEDLPGSTTFTSEIPGVAPGTVLEGAPVLANVDPGVSSRPIPTWAGATGRFVPAPAGGTGFTLGFFLVIPAGGTTDNADLVRIQVGGAANLWVLRYDNANDGQLHLLVKNETTDTILLNTDLVFVSGLNGKAVYIKVEAANSGANVGWYVQPYGAGTGQGATINSTSIAPIRFVDVGSDNLTDVGLGQIVVGDTSTAMVALGLDNALIGYAGETAAARVARVAALAGVAMTVQDGDVASAKVGPQPDGTLLTVLRDAEKAEPGSILRDSISTVGLVFTTRAYRYSQTPAVELDYDAFELSPPLEPTDDDQNIRNDVTATRANGSSARAVDTTGPLNALDYPDGIGLYAFSDTYNVYADAQLPDLAAWLLHQGTIDETRWPRLTVDLVKNDHLAADVDAVMPGNRLTVANLPTFQGTGSADLAVIGWTETIGANVRTVTFNCEPGGAATGYNVFILDDTTFGVLDADNRLAL
jgi:hypothetical protein